MKLDHYPPQEPLSPLGAAYQARILALGEGIEGEAHAYGADPYQTLTVFRPEAPSGDVLLFFHGGGWTSGYKEWMYFMAPALLAQGVTFVSAGYRLAPGHVFPAGFEDGADAVAWVWRHVAGQGDGAHRLFVGGHSAGGHYAALLAVTTGWRAAHGLPPDVLSGCLPVSGVYRLGADSGINSRPRFLGTQAPERADAAASPIARVEAAACPPFLITHGSRDFPHLIVQAQQMAAALEAAGVAVQTHILEGADHFEASVACGERPAGWPALAAAWMRQRAASPHPVDRRT
ncbi:alpha/beta hydrolase [Variovorax sp. PBL-E5]|uniref:alpha/beta hydrolase n=1 Tax=Variovorax sp. PBL-E5 TaxID=434014 RepID=UPI0013168148|nr:alpha/beta hydrolase [Variovorax sp. PBL-E5]VTU19189.1 Carboxylesterase NlhH [Variovorax sp. PBL-E5]